MAIFTPCLVPKTIILTFVDRSSTTSQQLNMEDSGGKGGKRDDMEAGKGFDESKSSGKGGGGSAGSGHDEKLAQFIAFTGATEDVANHWLEVRVWRILIVHKSFFLSHHPAPGALHEGVIVGVARVNNVYEFKRTLSQQCRTIF